jgi:TolB-like protein/Flp pilus assembly protein TadD
MATGERPFKGDTHISTISSILKDHPSSISEINHTLPRHLGRIVTHCLEKNPEKRFQTAKDVRNELEELKKEVDSGELAADVSGISTGAPTPSSVGAPPVSSTGVPPASSTGAPPVSSVDTPPPSSVGPPVSAPQPSSKRWLPWAGGAAFVIILLVVVWAMMRLPGKVSETSETSVSASAPSATAAADDRQTAVVLPFDNLGPAEDAYFAAGISEEITSRLAAASGLRVSSRTSAVQYDRTGKTMRQIGEDLGVDFVLEGAVRWARSSDGRGRVRITPQLIRVADDSQLWSAQYDREVDDIFEVQTDIANRVIDQLGVTLLGSEREFMDDKPTDNLEAYQAYLQAIDLNITDPGQYDSRMVELLERAIELDPTFMAPWYRLTRHHSDWYRFLDRTEARLSRAREALQRAESLDPDHPMTRLARGYYYYYGFRDYDRALEEFIAASEAVPNDSEALASIAYIYRRQGKLEQTVENLTKALELDPQNAEIPGQLAGTYVALRQFPEAIRFYDRAISISPDDYEAVSSKADTYIRWKGDLATAREILKQQPTGDPTSYHFGWFWASFYDRDYSTAREHIDKVEESSPFLRAVKATLIAIIDLVDRGPEGARGSLESAAQILEEILEEAPSNAIIRQLVSVMYVGLGRHDEALRDAKMAVELTAKDAFAGPGALENLAAVYGFIGRHDEAIDLVEQLLSTNYSGAITIPVLRLNPQWDPLREHPRFQELVKENGGV